MEISAEFKGIWMTRELVLSDLTIYEEKLLSIVWALDKVGSKGCDAGNKYLAKFMKGVKPTRISNILSSLIKQGHIKRTVTYKPNSKEIERRFLKVTSPLLLTLDRINSDPYLKGISIKNVQPTPITESEYPLHSEKTTPSPTVNTPLTQSESYNILNNIKDNKEEEKSSTQNSGSKGIQEKPSPALKSKPPVSEACAVNVVTPIDYEAKAEDLITAKIGTASRAVKDSWVIKYGPQIKASGMSPAEIVQGCAAHMRLNDRLLSYLTGSTLVREIEALPARRFISFFQNKWLPNVRPGKPTNNQLQNPKVLPTNTTLQYLN